jgi:hypothetical protein
MVFEVARGNSAKLLTIIAYPTAVFIPFALLAVNLKLHKRTAMRKYSVTSGLIGMGIGGMLGKLLSHDYLGYTAVLGIEVTSLLYWLLLQEYNTNQYLNNLNFSPVSARQFNKLIAHHNFQYISSPFSSATRDHYCGVYKGVKTCIVSVVTTGSAYLAIVFLLKNRLLPRFSIRPKGFYVQARDMLRADISHPLLPQALIDKYEVSTDDDAALASVLSTEVVQFLLNSESMVLEGSDSGLFAYKVERFRDEPENYLAAIEDADECASLMGVYGNTKNAQPAAADGLR